MITKTARRFVVAAVAAALSLTAIPANASNNINVTLSTSVGSFTYNVDPTETIAQFRDGALDDAGFAVYKHELRDAAGHLLLENTTLKSNFITDGSVISVGRAKGGLDTAVYRTQSVNHPAPGNILGRCTGNAWTSAGNVYFDFGSGVVAGCQSNQVWVSFTGYIAYPDSGYHNFCINSDDGNSLNLNGQEVTRQWIDQGGSNNCSGDVWFDANVAQSFRLEYYEHGGGASVRLSDNGNVTEPENFNTTANFLWNDPSVLTSNLFADNALTSNGKDAVANYLDSLSNGVSKLVVRANDLQGSVDVLLRSIRAELRKDGFRGSVQLIAQDAYKGGYAGANTTEVSFQAVYGG